MFLRWVTSGGGGLSLCSAVASAAYIQNFDSLTPGTINGQDQWTSNAWDVVQSTTAKSGQALQVTYPSSPTAPKRLNVFDPVSSLAQVRVEFDVNFSGTGPSYAGQSNASTTYQLHFVEPAPVSGDPRFVNVNYFAQSDSFGGVSKDWIQITSGNSQLGMALGVQANTWYHVILDLKWNQNAADLKIEKPDSSTLYDPPMVFMVTEHTTANNLTFAILQGPTPANMFIDNIATGPVPEPATLAGVLAGAALLSLARRRPLFGSHSTVLANP